MNFYSNNNLTSTYNLQLVNKWTISWSLFDKTGHRTIFPHVSLKINQHEALWCSKIWCSCSATTKNCTITKRMQLPVPQKALNWPIKTQKKDFCWKMMRKSVAWHDEIHSWTPKHFTHLKRNKKSWWIKSPAVPPKESRNQTKQASMLWER